MTFYNPINTSGIVNSGSISSSGALTCNNIINSGSITSSGVITSTSLSSPNFTGTTTVQNLSVSRNSTCNAGITLASSALEPTINILEYTQSADFSVSPDNSNRSLATGVVFNANSLMLTAGTYIISYKITLETVVTGSSTISYLSYGLSTTSSTQVAPSQLYDGNLLLVFGTNSKHKFSICF